MKTTIIKFALVVAAVVTSSSALAYTDEKLEVICKKPKFHDFSLPEYKEPDKAEVAPESEFEFKVSAWSDPKTVKLTAKNEKIPFTVESTTTFHRVKAKLPASFTGKFARINASVKSELGCDEQDGWLVKIADKKAVDGVAASPATEPATPAVAVPAASTMPESNVAAPQAASPAPGASSQPPQ